MTDRVRPKPDAFHSVTPYLVIKGAAQAIDFYKQAFGATEVGRMADPAGKIANAQIKIGDSLIMITDESPGQKELGTGSPTSLGASSVVISLYVEDVDAAATRAIGAGARVLIPLADRFYGDRDGRFADPFGHIWILSTHKEDVSKEEMERRVAKMMKHQPPA